jgi:hypothetical protein
VLEQGPILGRVLMGLAFCTVGIYSAVAIFLPKLRSNWRGSANQTRVLANVGVALAFTGAGLLLILPSDSPESLPQYCYATATVLGIACVLAECIFGGWTRK